jgi:hypothetical protein
MHITRDRVAKTVATDQSHYITDMLDMYDMTVCSPSTLPKDYDFVSGIASTTLPPLAASARDRCLHESVRQPPIRRHMLPPRHPHYPQPSWFGPSTPLSSTLQYMKKVLRYLKGTIITRLTWGGAQSIQLSGYSYAYCGSDAT